MLLELDQMIRANAHNPFEQVFNENTDLIDDLGYDSVDLINLVVQIEEKYNITFPDDFLFMDYLRSYVKLRDIVSTCLTNN